MTKYQKAFLDGCAVTFILTVALWFMVAFEVEKSKVTKGCLTWQGKTYSVVLYDTLEKPKKGATDGKDE